MDPSERLPPEWRPAPTHGAEAGEYPEPELEQLGLEELEQLEGDALVRVLSGIAFGLLVLFLCGVVLGALPLRLLDPRWQSDFCQAMIDHSAIPLTAFGLVHLAAFLVPNDERLLARRDAMRHAAVAVVLGFLLLIPLQGWALWQGWSAASGGRAAGLQRARSQIEQLRRAIDTAGSSTELQQRLRSLRAPEIPATELARPLPELKRLMEDRLEGFQARLEQRLAGGVDGRDLRERLPAALRVILVSLGMAVAWASGAEIPGVEASLLERGLDAIDNSRARRHGTARQNRGGTALDQEFFEHLASTDPPPADAGGADPSPQSGRQEPSG